MKPLYMFILTTFLQAFWSGSVTIAIVNHQWILALMSVFFLNLLWWYNIGKRIDYHNIPWIGMIYSSVIAIGTVLGAITWK